MPYLPRNVIATLKASHLHVPGWAGLSATHHPASWVAMLLPSFHRIFLSWWKEWLTSLGQPLWTTVTLWAFSQGIHLNQSDVQHFKHKEWTAAGKWNFRMASACQCFLLWSCELSYRWLSNQSLSSEQMWVIRITRRHIFLMGTLAVLF